MIRILKAKVTFLHQQGLEPNVIRMNPDYLSWLLDKFARYDRDESKSIEEAETAHDKLREKYGHVYGMRIVEDSSVDEFVIEHNEFDAHLKWACSVVDKWPAWKKNLLRDSNKSTLDVPRKPIVRDDD